MQYIKKLRKLAEEMVQNISDTLPSCDDIVNSLDLSDVPKERDESFISGTDDDQAVVSARLVSSIRLPDLNLDTEDEQLAEKNEQLYEKIMSIVESDECKQKIVNKLKTEFFSKKEIFEGETYPNYAGSFKHYWFEVDWPNADFEFSHIDELNGNLFFDVDIIASAEGGYSKWDSIL